MVTALCVSGGVLGSYLQASGPFRATYLPTCLSAYCLPVISTHLPTCPCICLWSNVVQFGFETGLESLDQR